MAPDYYLSLSDYISIMRRRAKLLAGVFTLIFSVAVVIAVMLPPVYQSAGTIMVESQRIPTDLVKATVTGLADERIEVIKQRVMTRENLLRIAERYELFGEVAASYTTSEMVDEMRSRIGIELVSATSQSGWQQEKTTIAFKISFEHRRPELAHRVVNELVTLFLDENVKVRTQRASETTKFLAQEADRLKAELDRVESQVAVYKQQHGNVLPDHLGLRMGMAQRLESELKDLEREYKATKEELSFLEVELSAARAGVMIAPGPTTGTGGNNPAQELEKLRSELAVASSRYHANHPDVRALVRKIEQLERGLAGAPSPASPDVPSSMADLVTARVQAKIAAANVRLVSLDDQQKSLRGRLADLEAQILKAPQVERELLMLMRDHENAQKKYEEVRAKQMSAQMAENLEEESKAERFLLLEPPLMPDKPVKPNRKKVVALGFFLALAGSGGLALMLESLGGRVRGARALTAVVRQPPLVVIPYIVTREESLRRRSLLKVVSIASAVLVILVLTGVHFFYTPLDLLVFKVLTRFE